MDANIIVDENYELSIIQTKIHEIRGCKVILDYDLAEMYGVETKNLNLSVKRNLKRFPPDFIFQLTNDEWNSLRFQIATSKRGGRRYLPYAFTEQGVAMLSGLLNSDTAIEMNIAIMRAFVHIRQLLFTTTPSERLTIIEHNLRELQHFVYSENADTRLQLELINRTLTELQSQKQIENTPRKRIGYRIDDKEDFI